MPRSREDDTIELFVCNLNPTITDDRLRQIFQTYGNVISAKVILDEHGESRRYGFVRFSTKEQGTKALNEFYGKIVLGYELVVQFARKDSKRLLAPRKSGDKERIKDDAAAAKKQVDTETSFSNKREGTRLYSIAEMKNTHKTETQKDMLKSKINIPQNDKQLAAEISSSNKSEGTQLYSTVAMKNTPKTEIQKQDVLQSKSNIPQNGQQLAAEISSNKSEGTQLCSTAEIKNTHKTETQKQDMLKSKSNISQKAMFHEDTRQSTFQLGGSSKQVVLQKEFPEPPMFHEDTHSQLSLILRDGSSKQIMLQKEFPNQQCFMKARILGNLRFNETDPQIRPCCKKNFQNQECFMKTRVFSKLRFNETDPQIQRCYKKNS
ncbi:hypothetical protein CDAR_193571 [Caerostris darwini]|uniref:Serine/arginine-rich splicing factor 2 n=1 Tax=Caerostris darwini TaxID=1538125 RepID=A0AAV4RNU8_9ARAC|nr:hypothetical protein CDAR_193571 [Caerostris darwini]